MDCLCSRMVPRVALTLSLLAGIAYGQAEPSQSAVSAPATTPSSSAAIQPSNEAVQPVEEGSATEIDPASLLPDLPSLPHAKASLIGGRIERLDRVRDQITVQVFGGGKMNVAFDPRTHIYRGSDLASTSDLHRGDRVYFDTILDGSTVFARNIRIKITTSAGESQGTVISYRADRGELLIRDALSPQPLKVHLTAQTRILDGGRDASASELTPGTLLALKFGPQNKGSDVAQEVSVLAIPGTSFTFAGRVTGLDLSTGLLVLISDTDGKTYEIRLDLSTIGVNNNLHPGADVTTVANFDGTHYVARNLTVNSQ